MGVNQKIKDVSNTTIIQASGPVIQQQGISAKDVIDICREIVTEELARHARQGKIVSEERFDTITRKIVDRLALVEENLTSRFEDPAVQMSTYDLIKGFIRDGDETVGERMVDVLMDRLKEKGRNAVTAVIDEAIRILPNLSEQSVAFLAFKVFSSIIVPGDRTLLKGYIETMSDIVDQAKDISKLDIAYLKQIGCCAEMQGFSSNLPLENYLLASYDLFFRHPISVEELNAVFAKHQMTIKGNDDMAALSFILSVLDFPVENKHRFKLTSSKHLEINLESYKMDRVRPILESIKSAMPPYSGEDLRRELAELSPSWLNVLDRFASHEVTSTQLNPVGYYIGRKRLGKIIPMEVGLDFFYQ